MFNIESKNAVYFRAKPWFFKVGTVDSTGNEFVYASRNISDLDRPILGEELYFEFPSMMGGGANLTDAFLSIIDELNEASRFCGKLHKLNN